jgi:hypothetical protein
MVTYGVNEISRKNIKFDCFAVKKNVTIGENDSLFIEVTYRTIVDTGEDQAPLEP